VIFWFWGECVRQSGKTRLVRSVFPDKSYVLLEDPDTCTFAEDDPQLSELSRCFLCSNPVALFYSHDMTFNPGTRLK
jgi:hypothetical protein